jgi:glyoxylase-like metal-dependent hydrolase (beta-lactamase superfamily II)
MNKKCLAQVIVLVLATVSANSLKAQGQTLAIKVITSNEGNLYTNYTLVMGEKEAVLIDAPFTRSEAHRLVGEILDSGRQLKYVYVTHDHPDHFFNAEVIAENFPEAEIISAPAVVEDIWRSIPFKLKRWGPMLGRNGPRHPNAPKAYEQSYFELEGKRMEILGPMQGDHRHATAVWIPSLSTLVAGDIVFHGIHVWLGEATPEQRDAWIKSLDELAGLNPKVVIAGHKLPGLADDPAALQYTRDYIVEFGKAVEKSKTSAELIAAMQKRFPDVQDVLNNFILGESAKVGVGEVPPWEE